LPCGGTLQLVVEPVTEQTRVAELLERIGKQQLVRRRLEMDSGRATLEPGRWQDVLEFDGRVLSSVHGPRWRLVLIGAGQLTKYLTEMARMLDYHVVVIDPREEYANSWDVEAVPINRGMPDDVVRELELDGHSALVALTHDPKLDDLALMEALKSAAFYVGAIGSKKNNDARRERLKEFDVSADEISRLRGPVGLYIGSKTPPEIAVAILAEMTAVRHGVSEPSWAAKPERRFDPSACEVPAKQPT
jgi:xanthine dehydrogenase accessory factor